MSRATVEGACDRGPLAVQLAPNLPHDIDADVRLPHAPDLPAQFLIALRSGGAQRRVSFSGLVAVIRRRSDLQRAADRPDSVVVPVVVDG